MSECDYTTPGFVPAIKQDKSMACWVTCGTMMRSWKDNQVYSIDEFKRALGAPYDIYYDTNSGLTLNDLAPFARATGLSVEPPQNPSITGWRDYLRAWGPLFVVTAELAYPTLFGVHARILIAMKGDCNPNATQMTLIDPDSGVQSDLNFSDFLSVFENLAGASPPAFQILHW